jgi:O-antigen ligase
MTSDVSQLLLSKRRRIFNLALILAILGLSAYASVAMLLSSTDNDGVFAALLLAGPLGSALIGASLICALFAWKILSPERHEPSSTR